MIQLKNIPNIISLGRIIFVPSLLVVIFYDHPIVRWPVFALYAIACISDFADGYVARKYNASSFIGSILDLAADKLLIIILSIVLMLRGDVYGYNHLLIAIPMIIIIIREIIMLAMRSSVKVSSTILAKTKTVIQMLALGFLLVGSDKGYYYQLYSYIGFILVYISAILTLITGYQYLKHIKTHYLGK